MCLDSTESETASATYRRKKRSKVVPTRLLKIENELRLRNNRRLEADKRWGPEYSYRCVLGTWIERRSTIDVRSQRERGARQCITGGGQNCAKDRGRATGEEPGDRQPDAEQLGPKSLARWI